MNRKTTAELTQAQMDVRDSAWRRINENIDLLIEQYVIQNGNILDADRAKELFPEYAASLETRRLFLKVVYEPAQAMVDEIFRRRLNEKFSGKRTVVFTAGGPGAGKSSLIEVLQTSMPDALAVMDGTLSDRVRALNNIDQALKTGCEVAVYYVHRPFRQAVQGVIDRALSPQSGRTVPMRIVAQKHFGAMSTIISLDKHYRTDQSVGIQCFNYLGNNLPYQLSSVREVEHHRKQYATLDAMEREAYRLVNERYERAQAGQSTFPPEVYQALVSDAPGFHRSRR